jgi:hypothetical protein
MSFNVCALKGFDACPSIISLNRNYSIAGKPSPTEAVN